MNENTQVIAKSKQQFDIQPSESLKKFIQSVTIRNKRTAFQYNFRLSFFERFLKENYKINLDGLIQKIKSTEYNPYDVLNDYCIYLQNNYNIGSLAFRD